MVSGVWGAPEILVVGKDMWFIGKIFRDFCAPRNVVLQTVIPGYHQSLGAAGNRRGHFRMTIDHIIGYGRNSPTHKEWAGFLAMTMMHLNSLLQKIGDVAPGKRVFGRDPKMPIGPVCNPHFSDFANPKGRKTTKTHHLPGVIRQFRQSSLTAAFNGVLHLR